MQDREWGRGREQSGSGPEREALGTIECELRIDGRIEGQPGRGRLTGESTGRIRILLVEDDPEWRRGLIAFLSAESDLEVAASAESADEVLAVIGTQEFDVVLMDIMLASRMEGIWLTSEVCGKSKASVIMLTSLADKEAIFGAFQAGATDYLVKSSFEEIPRKVREVYGKRSTISASVSEQLLEEFRRLKRVEQEYRVKQVKDRITPTELQVLDMIDRGFTQTQIADKFVVSIRTIKVHVGNILRKLGGQSSKEAAHRARELGLFEERREDKG